MGEGSLPALFCLRPSESVFCVAPPPELLTDQVGPIHAQIYEQIKHYEQKQEQWSQIFITDRDYSKPVLGYWLDKTRWHDYTQGYMFSELAALAYMHNPEQEPILQQWMRSLDAVLDQALQSATNHRINMFCCDIKLVQIRNLAEPSELIPRYLYKEPS